MPVQYNYAQPPRGEYPVHLGEKAGWSLDVYKINEDKKGRKWVKVKLWTPFGVRTFNPNFMPIGEKAGVQHSAFWLQLLSDGYIPSVKTGLGVEWAVLWRQDKALHAWAQERCKAYCAALKDGRARKPGETPEEAAARGIRVVAPSGKGA